MMLRILEKLVRMVECIRRKEVLRSMLWNVEEESSEVEVKGKCKARIRNQYSGNPIEWI